MMSREKKEEMVGRIGREIMDSSVQKACQSEHLSIKSIIQSIKALVAEQMRDVKSSEMAHNG